MIGHCIRPNIVRCYRTCCKRNASNSLSRSVITASDSRRGQRHTRPAKVNCTAARTTDVATDTEPTPRVSEATSHKPKVAIVAVVPADQQPSLGAPWLEVISHVADRLAWEDPDFQVQVFTDEALHNMQTQSQCTAAAQKAQILLLFDISSASILDVLLDSMSAVPTAIALDSHPRLEAATKLNNVTLTKPWEKAAATLPWSSSAKSSKVLQSVRDVYKRKTSDDLLFMLLVLIDAYITEVPLVKSMQAQDLSTVWKMCTKCGKQILACVRDPECKAALDCLTSCASNDQVCSFRCIVSYESQLLEDFSLCILQKNNCLGLHSDIPVRPRVLPMTHWKGQRLTHHQAEELFIGWLPEKRWSWRVVAGQNVAYDQFPCQYQLYYRGRARNSLWYDPVFQVITLDGKTVWRRRHYRVRRAEEPGTFHFSVLDNGVISKEFWRIVHVEEDLSWALFYYAGAASVVGQAYRGAVLLTPDGKWPAADQEDALEAALQKCGIKRWELYKVDNSSTLEAPLTIPEGPMKTLQAETI
ncbi:Vitamin D3 receptor [Trebouxia sp. C0009 RCD-2024]